MSTTQTEVRSTLRKVQAGKDNGFGGCTFMDMSEIKVYGTPS